MPRLYIEARDPQLREVNHLKKINSRGQFDPPQRAQKGRRATWPLGGRIRKSAWFGRSIAACIPSRRRTRSRAGAWSRIWIGLRRPRWRPWASRAVCRRWCSTRPIRSGGTARRRDTRQRECTTRRGASVSQSVPLWFGRGIRHPAETP